MTDEHGNLVLVEDDLEPPRVSHRGRRGGSRIVLSVPTSVLVAILLVCSALACSGSGGRADDYQLDEEAVQAAFADAGLRLQVMRVGEGSSLQTVFQSFDPTDIRRSQEIFVLLFRSKASARKSAKSGAIGKNPTIWMMENVVVYASAQLERDRSRRLRNAIRALGGSPENPLKGSDSEQGELKKIGQGLGEGDFTRLTRRGRSLALSGSLMVPA